MSLRLRIMLIVLLSILLPALSFGLYQVRHRDAESDLARRNLGALAKYAGENLDDKIKGTVQLLHGLSRAPELDTPDVAACSGFLAGVLARYPQYTGLLTLTPDGELRCDSLRSGRRLNVAGRDYFRQALETGEPAFDAVIGGLTGMAVLQVAYPVLAADGHVRYVLLASLNLSQYAEAFTAASGYPDMMMLIWNAHGKVIVYRPGSGAEGIVGREFASSPLYRFAAGGSSGNAEELPGLLGTRRIWALGIVPPPRGGGARITLGIPGQVLLANANRDLRDAFAVLLLVSLLAFLAAWYVVEIGIRRQGSRIMRVMARVGAGDLGARIGAPYPRGEIGELMAVIDSTAGAVERQRAELERHSRDLLRVNRTLRVVSEINALSAHVRERHDLFEGVCRIALGAGRFRMAWIAISDGGIDVLRPVARAGIPAEADPADGIDGESRVAEGCTDPCPAARPAASEPAAVAANERATAGVAWDDRFPTDHALAQGVLRSGETAILNDLRTAPLFRPTAVHTRSGARALALVPLRFGGHPAGVLALYSEHAGAFDDDECRLVHELASVVSLALDHIGNSQRLEYLAYYDPLTGLANSDRFQHCLADHVDTAGRRTAAFALLIVDLEQFKRINDIFGTQGGDDVLVQFAARLADAAGAIDRCGRFAGDRFGIVIPDVRNEDEVMRATAPLLARCLDAPFTAGGSEVEVSVKFGVALFPADGADAPTLFRNAETALKATKAKGHRHMLYARGMNDREAENLALERSLRKALEREEFVLHYQPQVDLRTGRMTSVEALLRWRNPQRGLVSPLDFVPLLEQTGMILDVGAWALGQAARDYRSWVARGFDAPRIAVNVSPIQMRQRNFVAVVRDAIASVGGPAGIDLEITESVLMEDVAANVAKLNAIRRLGINVAIDDFGTGYSSLSYLARLPVQAVKIDRSFVATMLREPDTATLVATMISLGHALRLKVIAEGVETGPQVKLLRDMGCDAMQGYYLSRPLPVEGVTALLESDVRLEPLGRDGGTSSIDERRMPEPLEALTFH